MDKPVLPTPNKAQVAAGVKAPPTLWSHSNPTCLRCINGLELNLLKPNSFLRSLDQIPSPATQPKPTDADKVKKPVQPEELGKDAMSVFSAAAEAKRFGAYKELLFDSKFILHQLMQMGISPNVGPHKALVNTIRQQVVGVASALVQVKSVAELNTVIILVMKYDQDIQGLIRDWDIKANHQKPFSIGTDESMGKGTSI